MSTETDISLSNNEEAGDCPTVKTSIGRHSPRRTEAHFHGTLLIELTAASKLKLVLTLCSQSAHPQSGCARLFVFCMNQLFIKRVNEVMK